MLREDECSLMPEIRASSGLVVVVRDAGLLRIPALGFSVLALLTLGAIFVGQHPVHHVVASLDLSPLDASDARQPQF